MWYRLRGLDDDLAAAEGADDHRQDDKEMQSKSQFRGNDEEDCRAGDEIVLLPVRRVAEELNWLENFRGFVLFLLFFAFYFSLNTVRLDWWKGHETIKMLEASRLQLEIPALVDGHNLQEANTYLVHGLPEIAVALKQQRCLNCKVGITPVNRDMNHLSLTQFICSDFLSTAGSDDYPSRDCAAADAEFAQHPSSAFTPCCADPSLVRASVAVMAEHYKGTPEVPQSLERLLGGVTELTSELLGGTIDERGGLYQVIVSRDLRMAGIQYYATWVDKENAPGHITPKSEFWSYSYTQSPLKINLLMLTLLFGTLSLVHEIIQPWAENVESIYGYVTTPFMLLIEIPTVVVPPMLELFKTYIDVSEYTMFVTLLELLLVVRLFEEGEIVPPLRLFVSVLNHAGPMLLKFIAVLFPMIGITAAAQSQLFGPFDDGYADYATSVSRIVHHLTAPPPTEGPVFEHTNIGAQIMYYWSTFVLRLAFGSFLVAILVGAFNKATVSLAADKASLKLPRGFERVGIPAGFFEASYRLISYCIMWRVHGVWGPGLVRTLKVAEANAQALLEVETPQRTSSNRIAAADSEYSDGQVMLTGAKLRELIGTRLAEWLLKEHGCIASPSKAL
jgi:hypothetical protein